MAAGITDRAWTLEDLNAQDKRKEINMPRDNKGLTVRINFFPVRGMHIKLGDSLKGRSVHAFQPTSAVNRRTPSRGIASIGNPSCQKDRLPPS